MHLSSLMFQFSAVESPQNTFYFTIRSEIDEHSLQYKYKMYWHKTTINLGPYENQILNPLS